MPKASDNKLDAVMRQIKSLMAMAEDVGSPEEAIAASLKAQELINKYNISLTTQEKDYLEVVQLEYTTGIDKSWKYQLSQVVGKNFRVEHFWRAKKTVVFYGYKQDCEVAVKVFEYLFKIGERGARRECRKAYKETGTETGIYFSYTRGFLKGVQNKLEVQCTALMIITPKEIKDAFEEYCEEVGMGSLGKYRTGAEEKTHKHMYKLGIKEGEDAAGNKPLESVHKQSGRLTGGY